MTFELTHMSDWVINWPSLQLKEKVSVCVCVWVQYTICTCIDGCSPGCLLPLHLLSVDGQQFVQLSEELRGRGPIILLTQDEPDPLCCCGDCKGMGRKRERQRRGSGERERERERAGGERKIEREQRGREDHMRVWGSVVKAKKSHDWNLSQSQLEGQMEILKSVLWPIHLSQSICGQEKGQLFKNTGQRSIFISTYFIYSSFRGSSVSWSGFFSTQNNQSFLLKPLKSSIRRKSVAVTDNFNPLVWGRPVSVILPVTTIGGHVVVCSLAAPICMLSHHNSLYRDRNPARNKIPVTTCAWPVNKCDGKYICMLISLYSDLPTDLPTS